mmetsp:Transcript_11786/g.31814  ORF Transcript_11786/g.31814 Transcript_11786/m.31814 type:complete len:246 (-) Transcript_11786:19-756(-)
MAFPPISKPRVQRHRDEGSCARLAEEARRLLRLWSALLSTYPYMGGTSMAFLLAAAGDVAAQFMEASRSQGTGVGLDWWRTFSLSSVNGFWSGIIFRTWTYCLEAWVSRKDFRGAMFKVALSQLFLTPVVYMPYFYIVHGALTGQSLASAITHLETESFALDLRCWALYGPSNYVMFRYVPVDFQVLFSCSVSLLWNFLLSLEISGPNASIADVTAVGFDRFGGTVQPVAFEFTHSRASLGGGGT